MSSRAVVAAVAMGLIGGGGASLPVAPAASATVGPACTVRWSAPVNGAWSDAARWSTGSLPGQADDVCIDLAGTYRVVLSGSFSVRSLSLGGAPGAQLLSLVGVSPNGASLALAAPSTISTGGELEVQATDSIARVDGAGSLTNNGIVRSLGSGSGSRILGIDLTNAPGATMQIGGPTTVVGLDGNTTTNNGTISVMAGAGLHLQDSTYLSNPGSRLDISPTGTAWALGSSFRQAGGAVSGGPLVLRNGSILADGSGAGAFRFEPGTSPSSLSGTIPAEQVVTVVGTADGDGSADLVGPVVNNGFLALAALAPGRSASLTGSALTNNGSLLVLDGPAGPGPRYLRVPVTNSASGSFGVQADTSADTGTSIVNRGLVALDAHADLVLSGGSFTNSPSGTLRVTVSPGTPDVSVLGGATTAYLDGTLDVATVGTPTPGATYSPISVSSRIGTFSALTFGTAPYEALYSPIGVRLLTSPPRTRFVPVAPVRALDTRVGIGAAAGRVSPGGVVRLPIAGASAGATAVVLTVTGVDSSPGYVTVWPTGEARPVASSLNFTRQGQTSAGQVVVPVGSDGSVSLFTSGGGHLLADVAGWYEAVATATSGRFNAIAPRRILDTRDGTGGAAGRRAAGASLTLPVAGQGGVPAAGASAVVLSVTEVEAAPGFVSVWPAGQVRPNASNLNTDLPSQTVAAHVVAPLGANGSVSLFTSGGGHLLVDVVGWFTDATAPAGTSGLYVALSPARRLDTRTGLGVTSAGPRSASSTVGLLLGGAGGIPSSGVAAVVSNLTAVQSAPGFLTVWAGGAVRPLASNLNVSVANDTVPNLVTSPVGSNAFLDVYTSASTHLLLDTSGYYQA